MPFAEPVKKLSSQKNQAASEESVLTSKRSRQVDFGDECVAPGKKKKRLSRGGMCKLCRADNTGLGNPPRCQNTKVSQSEIKTETYYCTVSSGSARTRAGVCGRRGQGRSVSGITTKRTQVAAKYVQDPICSYVEVSILTPNSMLSPPPPTVLIIFLDE